jgi:hypothetical protein
VVLGAGELPEAEGPEHGHVLFEVLDDDLDVVDLGDHGHGFPFPTDVTCALPLEFRAIVR